MPAESKLMRVAACQILTTKDIAFSTRKTIEWIDRAAEQKVRLVAFPEGTLFGYTEDRAFWRKANVRMFQQAERKVAAACRRHRVAAVIGSAHVEEGTWRNSLAIFDPKGELVGRYSKNFLAGERWCSPGREIPIHEILGIPCCFLICHDVRYPELVRLPAVRGAKLCIYCSCESGLSLEHKLSAYRAMPISRAAENGIWLVMANAPADTQHMTERGQSHGNSKIIDPHGNVLIEAGYFEERLVVSDIEIDLANRWIAQRIADQPSPVQGWIWSGAGIVTTPSPAASAPARPAHRSGSAAPRRPRRPGGPPRRPARG